MAIFSAIAAVFKAASAAIAAWIKRRIFKAGETKAKFDAMEEGAERQDEAQEIMARPVRKGAKLLARMRARARARMQRDDLDE